VRRAQELGVAVADFPNVVAHFERMRARPSVKKVEAFEKGVLADFAKAG